ncbi:hypothetical protein P280DRAFT_474231 [Massarina eburnea CBS 473.64]|uniref:Uncharacterized protein n=1 Tax=Massarina eburnea CBS 473.64 TaxID=1395130 RepID=A0A6A6RI17_9PLEO|nr:hypothetical protein P280DRAFT_474231 [Massarina eburnea CBS 473.64]
MAHICGELQQWKCLRNYLYNPARQAYQVSAPAKVTAYWGPYEVTHRQQIKSIPWQFTELSRFQVWNKYPPGHEDKMPHDHIVGSLSDMFPNHLLADHRLALHECLQYEFLQEYQRIHRIPTPQDRDPQLLHLADGMRTFLTKLVCKWALKGVLELQNWLVPWLADPLRVRLPVVGFERVFEGGLFFGVHLFQRDMLGFVREVQRNAKKNLVSREKS